MYKQILEINKTVIPHTVTRGGKELVSIRFRINVHYSYLIFITCVKVKRPLLLEVVKVYKRKKPLPSILVKVSLAINIANKAGDSHPGMTTLL